MIRAKKKNSNVQSVDPSSEGVVRQYDGCRIVRCDSGARCMIKYILPQLEGSALLCERVRTLYLEMIAECENELKRTVPSGSGSGVSFFFEFICDVIDTKHPVPQKGKHKDNRKKPYKITSFRRIMRLSLRGVTYNEATYVDKISEAGLLVT